MAQRTVNRMDYITKETLDKYIDGKSVIKLDVLAEMFEKEFGIIIPLRTTVDYSKMTEQQKRQMTQAIFSNDAILDQIRESSARRDYIEDDQEALTIIQEAKNGQ